MSTETVPDAAAAAKEPTAGQGATLADYFALERGSEMRHEYVDGHIIAMSGESPDHNRIARNISFCLEREFGDRPCESFIEGVRTRVSATRYRYPDIAALCGEAEFDSERPPSLLNPSVIFEVLSPSTEEFDREGKFGEYRHLVSLMDYLLVEQDRVEVTHYVRESAQQWTVRIFNSLSDRLELRSLGVSVTLADIYRKIAVGRAPSAGP